LHNRFAFALPAFALSATSWNASNTRRVFFNASAANSAIQHHQEVQLKEQRYNHQA
jgi:hypothetical protein